MPADAVDISRLYADHIDDLILFLVRRTADAETALDLAAETFAQAVLSSGKYRGTTDLEAAAWLFGIARNLLSRYYRRGKAEQRAVRRLGMQRPELSPEAEASIMRRAELSELRGELSRALATLTDEVRSAVTLRVVDELPYADVAARLGVTEQAARSRVSRGLSALADAIDHHAIAEGMPT